MFHYSKLKIRWQIAIPIAILGLMLITVGYNGLKGMTMIGNKVDLFMNNIAPSSRDVVRADRDLFQALGAIKEIVILSSQGQSIEKPLKEFKENTNEAKERMATGQKLAIDAGAPLPRLEETDKLFQAWFAICEQIIDQVNAGRYLNALNLLDEKQQPAFDTLRQHYVKISLAIKDYTDKIATEVEIVKQNQRQVMFMMSIIGATTVILAIIFIPSIIARQLDRLTKLLSDLSSGGGDLTYRIPIESKNEIANVAQEINQFVIFLQKMIAEASAQVEQMASTVPSMVEKSSQTGKNAELQNNSVNQISTAIQQMQTAIKEVATSAQNTSMETRKASDDIANANDTISHSFGQINILSSDMNEVVSMIGKLKEESDNIVSVLDVIGGIAEQTNLLALNAAIEAARAGEQGRGFAVVADEVRTLASRTQQSTQDIQKMIDRLQTGVQNAVQSMERANEQVVETVKESSLATESLGRVVNGINVINDMSLQIAAATEEQSVVANHVNESIQEISTHAQQLSDSAEQTRNDGASLSKSVDVLAGHMSKFKV